ncbi:MAG: ABC transporter ATP-binding protein, partial [Planctomycetota bacterium]
MKLFSKLDFIPKLFALLERRERWMFAGVMVVALFMAFFQVLGIASILPFMRLFMAPESLHERRWLSWLYEMGGFSSVNSFIYFFGATLLVIIITGNLVSIFGIWLRQRFVWRNNHNVSTALLKKYLSLPYVYFLNQHSSDLAKNVLSEVRELTLNFLRPLMEILTQLTVTFFIIIMLFVADPVTSIFVAIILGGSYICIYMFFRGKLRESGRKRLEANRGRYKAANEALTGIKDIKILGLESYFVDMFMDHSLKMTYLRAWNKIISKAPRYLMEMVAFGGALVFVLTMMSTEGGADEIIPKITFFAFAGYRLMPALQKTFNSAARTNFSRAAFDRVYHDTVEEGLIHAAKVEQVELPEPLLFEEAIRLEDVTFCYPGASEPAVRGVNIKVDRHGFVAVAGTTGAGKTTVVDILLGLLTPQEGRLMVDDREVTEKNVRNWQRDLGYVPQQIHLSDDTIERNIAFGLPDEQIDRDQVEQVARIANIHDFISGELPDGYGTVAGEQGVRLSGGQKQRIGIARALYHDPEVLVLDEATSSLDGITEDAVLEAMANAAELKTMVVIAHRLTTLKNCDIIYMMDKGEVVATGTYQELLQENEQFQAMAKT